MSWIATAVIGGAVISGIASNQAANTAADASNQSNQRLLQQYQQTRTDELPYIQSGYGAQGKLNYLLGIGPNPATTTTSGTTGGIDWAINNRFPNSGGYLSSAIDWARSNAGGSAPSSSTSMPSYTPQAGESFGELTQPFTAQNYLQNQDPGYQFQLQQGVQAVQNSAAANSGSLSGAALKDLISYNQDYAKTGYSDAFNRWMATQNNIYARLSGIAQQGQNAATQTGTIGAGIAGQQSANTTAAANTAANAYVSMGNNISNSLSDMALLKMLKG